MSESRGDSPSGGGGQTPSTGRPENSGQSGTSGSPGTTGQPRTNGQSSRSSQSARPADPVADFQRWLMKAGARSMANQVADQVKRTLGQDRKPSANVWDTATNEPPPNEPPECQWCPVCQAPPRARVRPGPQRPPRRRRRHPGVAGPGRLHRLRAGGKDSRSNPFIRTDRGTTPATSLVQRAMTLAIGVALPSPLHSSDAER